MANLQRYSISTSRSIIHDSPTLMDFSTRSPFQSFPYLVSHFLASLIKGWLTVHGHDIRFSVVRPRIRIPLICRLNKVHLADAQKHAATYYPRPTCTLQLAHAWALNCGKLPRKSGNRTFNSRPTFILIRSVPTTTTTTVPSIRLTTVDPRELGRSWPRILIFVRRKRDFLRFEFETHARDWTRFKANYENESRDEIGYPRCLEFPFRGTFYHSEDFFSTRVCDRSLGDFRGEKEKKDP